MIIELNKNYNYLFAQLGKRGEDARKYVKDYSSSLFLEMFYRATISIIKEKLNK